jgi:LPS-assembly protein
MNGNGKSSENDTVQTLPELDAFAFQQSLFGSGLEASFETKYNYFHREYGNSGHRLRATPELKLPLKSDVLTVIPSLSVDHTSYNLTQHEDTGDIDVIGTGGRDDVIDTSKIKDGFQSRTTWSGGFTAFSEMSRTFALTGETRPEPSLAGTSRWAMLKHSITPRVEYSYSPYVTGQDSLPYFDSLDRLEGRNKVTYSLTNVLDRRRDSVVLSPGEDGEPVASVAKDYLDFLLFRLEQSYDLREANRNDERGEYERRPFSDFMAELKIKPTTFIDILTRNWFSPYLGDMTQSETSVRLYKKGVGEFSVGYDYLEAVDEYLRTRDDPMSIVSLEGSLELSEAFTLGAKYRHDFNSERDLERTIKLNWAGECYTLYFAFTQKSNDNRFVFGFDLLNF